MMVLELYLALRDPECAEGEQMIKRVVLEMDLDETRTFVAKLKAIEKEINAASK